MGSSVQAVLRHSLVQPQRCEHQSEMVDVMLGCFVSWPLQ